MKLRIKGNSLRLRLTQGEIRELAESGVVQEQVHFGAGEALTYQLRRDGKTNAITATYSGNVIEVRVPERTAREWCETDMVTLAHSQGVTGGDELKIVLEKDFACLAPREDEDESDNFPHPQAGSGSNRC